MSLYILISVIVLLYQFLMCLHDVSSHPKIPVSISRIKNREAVLLKTMKGVGS